MNCDTYLSMLATLPVGELDYGDARQHAAGCRDCDRVTRVVIERERNMLVAYNELHPPLAPEPVAAHALELSRRRRIVGWFRGAVGVAAVAAVFFLYAERRAVPEAASVHTVTETFRLTCLSPDQAMEVIRLHASRYTTVRSEPGSLLRVVQVSGPPGELPRLRSIVAEYDTPSASQCGLQAPAPVAPPQR